MCCLLAAVVLASIGAARWLIGKSSRLVLLGAILAGLIAGVIGTAEAAQRLSPTGRAFAEFPHCSALPL